MGRVERKTDRVHQAQRDEDRLYDISSSERLAFVRGLGKLGTLAKTLVLVQVMFQYAAAPGMLGSQSQSKRPGRCRSARTLSLLLSLEDAVSTRA